MEKDTRPLGSTAISDSRPDADSGSPATLILASAPSTSSREIATRSLPIAGRL
jgi:hypothetical protein